MAFKDVKNQEAASDLSKRILITILLLGVYRMGVFIPTPGIDAKALSSFFAAAKGTMLDVATMFTGGALENFSVFALGIMPYITAAIILQLLTAVVPSIEKLSKEGEQGRKKITEYTRYLTIVIAIFQAFIISMGLERMTGSSGESIVMNPGWGFRLLATITLTSGTAFIMWLGEQITERGVGNGISLIITAGIVASMPAALGQTITLVRTGQIMFLGAIVLILLVIAIVAIVVYFETAQRRIPIQSPKRIVGRNVMGGAMQHLPLKLNVSGVIPPIFASSLLLFPATIVTTFDVPALKSVASYFDPTGLMYNILFGILIIFFAYFYTAIQFNPKDVAENLKKNGNFVPGIRPGANTAEYIEKVLERITLWGSLYLAAVCILPSWVVLKFGAPFYFGGTAILIVVTVAIDTAQQIESHMLSKSYQGLLKKGKIKGRSS
ncbi:MAG: preprotein translocase subunit SecY [Deltaproteobacteria bacterium]|nr:preprotein translocase subunit SecY [Deltaproteobacteria bacterium]